MKPTFALVLTPLLLLLAGCEEPWSEESDLDLTPGFLERDVETGETRFVAHADRDTIVMERGFQGGQHIQPTLLTDDLEDFAELNYRADIVDPGSEAILDSNRGALGAYPAEDIGEDPTLTYLSPRVLLRDTSLEGREVELRVTLYLPGGEIGRAPLRGVVELHDPFAP